MTPSTFHAGTAEQICHQNVRRWSCRKARRGFTLIEMMVTVSIIAVIAITVAPAFQDQDRLKLVAGAELLRSDIQLAQVMTISTPSDPIVVRFDSANSRYWLATPTNPETPIAREDTGDPYLVVLGTGRAGFAVGVAMAVVDMPSATLTFNELGGLEGFATSPTVRLTIESRRVDMNISTTTGSITEKYVE